MKKYRLFYNSPIGNLEIVGTDEGIENIIFVHMISDLRSCCPGLNSVTALTSSNNNLNISDYPQLIQLCVTQLNEYFDGNRKDFQLKLNPKGTEFQHKIWDLVKMVSYGETTTYQGIASSFGDSKAVRAVGYANSRNPIPIIIPCHRIIGKDRKLTGYSGGLIRKSWLLSHESNSNINLFAS